jgi:hypothetical protein
MPAVSNSIRAGARLMRAHAVPLGIALAIAFAYYLIDLRGGDLAAHLYRAELFERQGFFVWNYNWYGGHYVVSYGVIFPGLSATIGVRLAGALAYIAGTLLFSILARRAWPGSGGRAAAIVFAVSFSATLVIGQLPFAFGVTFGLAAMLAAAADRKWLTAFLAVNCALTSPLAALFVAFVAFVVWVERREQAYLHVVAFTIGPATVVSLLFPEGGAQPFHVASYLGALFATAVFWFAVRDEGDAQTRRLIATGTALYVLFLTANELVASPVGGNAIRLGMLLFAPIAAALLWPRAGRYALAFIIPLFGWQAGPAVWAIATHDRTGDPGYFAPLNQWLDQRDPTGSKMVEVVFTRNHFEAAYVANRRPIARGWERQLDLKYNGLFYDGQLTAGRYHSWLSENDVHWVAVPKNATIDYSGRDEADLIARSPAYLQLAADLRDWQVYEFTGRRREDSADPQVLAASDGERLLSIRPASYGSTVTDLRWQRFLRPSYGCIQPTADGRLALDLPQPSDAGYASAPPPAVTLTADYSLRRLIAGGESCAEDYDEQEDRAYPQA